MNTPTSPFTAALNSLRETQQNLDNLIKQTPQGKERRRLMRVYKMMGQARETLVGSPPDYGGFE